jgi:hypothetical protein
MVSKRVPAIGPWKDLHGQVIPGDDEERGRGFSLVGCDLQKAALKGQLSNIDVSLANLSQANFHASRLIFVLAAYTSFRGADFSDCDLWQLKAYRCDFTEARFDRTQFRGVSAIECNFEGVDLTTVTFSGADPTGALPEAVQFCRRFGIAIDRRTMRSGRPRGHGKPDEWGDFDGPCDFTGSTGIPPDVLARILKSQQASDEI